MFDERSNAGALEREKTKSVKNPSRWKIFQMRYCKNNNARMEIRQRLSDEWMIG